jgi:chromosome segregation ATPase
MRDKNADSFPNLKAYEILFNLSQVEELYDRINQIKRQNQSEGEESEKLQKKLIKTEEDLAQADNLLEKERDEYAHLEDHLKDVKTTSQTSRKKRKAELKNKTDQIKNLETEKQDLENNLNLSNQEIDRLKTQISILESRLKGVRETTSTQKLETAQRYQRRIKQLTGIECKEENLTKLAAKLGGAKLTDLPETLTLAEYLAQNQDHDEHLEGAHADIIKLENEAAEKDREITKLGKVKRKLIRQAQKNKEVSQEIIAALRERISD